MTEIIITIIAIALSVKAIKLILKLSWGMAKIIATVLLILAIPVFGVCLILTGGLMLLIPVAIIAAAIGIVKLLA